MKSKGRGQSRDIKMSKAGDEEQETGQAGLGQRRVGRQEGWSGTGWRSRQVTGTGR